MNLQLPEHRGPRLLSDNPEKRKVELLFLAYTPLWIAAVAVIVLFRLFVPFGDRGYLLLGLSLSVPLWLLPFLVEPRRATSYLTKATLFIAILSMVQNAYGARLFFDGLGMTYRFPVTITWNRTPVFLYLMTVSYFTTYFVGMQIAWRLFVTTFPKAGWPIALLVRGVLCYAVAFAETYFMANPYLADFFSYRDKNHALFVGSLCYGTLFFITLPLFYRIDEGEKTPVKTVFWQALGANVLILLCYDAYLAVLLR